MRHISRWIKTIDWIIPAIGKHVIAQEALAGGCEGIGIEKSADCWIVIPGLAVVHSTVGIINISAVAQGVIVQILVVCGIQNVTPGIVLVDAVGSTAGIDNPHHVTLGIQHVVQHGAVVLHGEGLTVLVVEEVHGNAGAHGHPHQSAALVIVGVNHTIHSLAVPQAIGIIGVADAAGAVGSGGKLTAVLPREGPPSAVVVAGGVADSIFLIIR